MVLSSEVLGIAPITASFFSPLLKIMIVGMLRTPYWVAIEGLSSVFSLKQLSLPVYCFASSLITGWIIRQGPHHGAQNSTSTGPSALRTSEFHVASVTPGTAAQQENESVRRTYYSKQPRHYQIIGQGMDGRDNFESMCWSQFNGLREKTTD